MVFLVTTKIRVEPTFFKMKTLNALMVNPKDSKKTIGIEAQFLYSHFFFSKKITKLRIRTTSNRDV